ncbi:hypothetical protein GQ457_12G008270 [Hibiscus cannabinus]
MSWWLVGGRGCRLSLSNLIRRSRFHGFYIKSGDLGGWVDGSGASMERAFLYLVCVSVMCCVRLMPWRMRWLRVVWIAWIGCIFVMRVEGAFRRFLFVIAFGVCSSSFVLVLFPFGLVYLYVALFFLHVDLGRVLNEARMNMFFV